MKKFDLKKHNQKMFELTKSAARGTYPSKNVARLGSIIGTVIGIAFVLAGFVGLLLGGIWSVSSLLVGVTTVVSNVLNLKRVTRSESKGKSSS